MWIKNRIEAEQRKHYKVTGGCDWMRLAEQKILSQLKEQIEEVGLEDVVSFLEGLKDFRVEGALPLGTCDYMAIDDMIVKIKKLLSLYSDKQKENKE